MDMIPLANDALVYVKKLDDLDCVMIWVTRSPLEYTAHLTCAEAAKLGRGSIQAEMKHGGLMRLRAIDGHPGIWLLSVWSGGVDAVLRLTPDTAREFKALLKREAGVVEGWDAIEAGIEPGNGVGEHIGDDSGRASEGPSHSG